MLHNNNEQPPRTDFKIWQQNLRKSPNAWEHMLKNLDPTTYDLACIQEPHLNRVGLANASTLGRYWEVLYPTNHHNDPARAQTIMLVNKKLSKNNWHIIPLDTPNITAIELNGDFGKVRIYNVYNACDHARTLQFLERHMRAEDAARHINLAQGETQTAKIIWLGDFNRHHPMWEMTSNSHLFTAANLDAAGVLINLLAAYNLIQALPQGIATLEASNTKNHTRPDNVFCSAELEHTFTQCSVEYQLRPVITDHFPIISTLDLRPERTDTTPKSNYRNVEWNEFREALSTHLNMIPLPTEINSTEQFNAAFTHLTHAIAAAVNDKVPKSNPSSYAKRWWSKELDAKRKKVHKLGAKARDKLACRLDPIHEEFRTARNNFSNNIKKAKEEHWVEWLESLTPAGTWNFHRYAASNPADQVHTRIKTLKDPRNPQGNSITQDNARKSELLYDVFFRPAPEDEHVEPNFNYNPPICEFAPITDSQISRAIAKLSPYKAPGPNGISNSIYTHCADLLVQYMGPIFRATFTLGIYPDAWKHSSTIVLRKPGRPDYSLPKAYRPITLLDTMAKILSSCVADDLVYIAERHNLLPPTHFGGRPGRSTVDSLHLLTKFAMDAWASEDKFVSFLFLDVKAAFPSVVVNRMLHNMRKSGIPTEYIDWYSNRLSNRTTTLSFDDYRSTQLNVVNGVDQGCPLSVIGFLFYNADVLRVANPDPRRGELSLGFIDDIALAARGRTYEEANGKLKEMMEKPGGALDWSREHNADFELDKTALLCVSRRRAPDPAKPGKTTAVPRPPIIINGHTINPSVSHKFLGVIVDQELNFKEHASYALAKGTGYTMACSRMSRPTKGIHGRLLKKLFEGVVVPKMLYAADVWCSGLISKGKGKKAGGRGARGFASKMTRVQRMATTMITGGMRTSATDLLDAHANVLPFQQLLRRTCHKATLRMVTLDQTHPLHKGIRTAYNSCARRNFKSCKRHPSPLHRLLNEYRLNPQVIETIAPIRHYPKWETDVTTQVAQSPEAAIIEDTIAQEDLRVYSDGSAIDGGVGGAAVLMRGEEVVREKRFHLGNDGEHTVYEGELIGMILAVELLREEGGRGTLALGVDNQAAITATRAFNSKPGHYLMDIFHDDLRKVIPAHDQRKLVIRWTPGHHGIPGNEAADEQAKLAAQGESSEYQYLPKSLVKRNGAMLTLPISKSALKQQFNHMIKNEAKAVMQQSPRFPLLRKIDQSAPSKHFMKLSEGLPRRHSSLLFQLRTGHIPLNKYLHRIAKAPSPTCQKCHLREESVHHFLIVCPAYARQRHELQNKIGPRASDLKNLLNDRKCIKPLFRFIANTRRLEQTFGDVTPPSDDDDDDD